METFREKAIAYNNVGVSFHRSKNLGLALQWYILGLRLPSTYKCPIFENCLKQNSTSEAELATQNERASLILWSEKLMDEAFYLDPYQEKSFTYLILPVDLMPSGNIDLVLFDAAAERIDTSCLESHDSSPTGSNKVNAVLVC